MIWITSDCSQYPETLPRVMADPGLRSHLEKQGSGELYFLAFNNAQAPFDTLLARKALQLSVDRDAMIKVLHNAALTVEGVIPPGMNCWSPLPGRITMNRDVARELLAQAGYPEGMSFKLATLADDAPLKNHHSQHPTSSRKSSWPRHGRCGWIFSSFP